MPTNFYYFKFIATEWLTGDIVFESLSVQGLFINICALYWQRSGKLTLQEIKNRYKNPPELDELIGKYIISKKTEIKIKFLDEQLVETTRISKVNKTNGLKGGRPKNKNNPSETHSVSTENQSIVRSIVELEEEVEVSKPVSTTTVLHDEITAMFHKIRPELPEKILQKERLKFETVYPERSLPKHAKLVIEWAERINYTPRETSKTTFDKLAAQNKQKYGL